MIHDHKPLQVSPFTGDTQVYRCPLYMLNQSEMVVKTNPHKQVS